MKRCDAFMCLAVFGMHFLDILELNKRMHNIYLLREMPFHVMYLQMCLLTDKKEEYRANFKSKLNQLVETDLLSAMTLK